MRSLRLNGVERNLCDGHPLHFFLKLEKLDPLGAAHWPDEGTNWKLEFPSVGFPWVICACSDNPDYAPSPLEFLESRGLSSNWTIMERVPLSLWNVHRYGRWMRSKYFGPLRGITWYNLLSDQFTGLNAIPVPGTLRDSLVLLAVVLEQQTELKPTQIMTDTGAYSDVVFGFDFSAIDSARA